MHLFSVLLLLGNSFQNWDGPIFSPLSANQWQWTWHWLPWELGCWLGLWGCSAGLGSTPPGYWENRQSDRTSSSLWSTDLSKDSREKQETLSHAGSNTRVPRGGSLILAIFLLFFLTWNVCAPSPRTIRQEELSSIWPWGFLITSLW